MSLNMKQAAPLKRRDFLKLGATACAAAGMFSLAGCVTERTTNVEIASNMDGKSMQLGMVINVPKLNELGLMDTIVEACHTAHNVPNTHDKKTEVKWIWSEDYESAFEEISSEYVANDVMSYEYPVMCNHCENPACVRECPTKATFKRSDGIVMMDFHRCIGCRFCMKSCPYNARSLNFSDPREYLTDINDDFPTREKGVVEKCLFCYDRVDKGLQPLCVEASQGSILFGDLTDPNSDVRQALANAFSIRRRVELGTGPCIYYIFEEGE